MKQFRILSMLMIVLISSLSFVSCGDDDDETSGDFSASIAGVYTGKLKVGTNVTADACSHCHQSIFFCSKSYR